MIRFIAAIVLRRLTLPRLPGYSVVELHRSRRRNALLRHWLDSVPAIDRPDGIEVGIGESICDEAGPDTDAQGVLPSERGRFSMMPGPATGGWPHRARQSSPHF
ncbi:hypothetical protein J7I98_21800 [Streptomyces sp. ISL-98]|uniref:hypothetical protein n=1 Tax=Streptomyces sp. ISL-98 TaxID=2819192 RepID=UPI001BE82D8B|nr:hypothetical protein [Streptomyces sp. ISL-98]MBT2508473.1 hypothetical protein [Streptomyces sp. ISL-98]